MRLQQLIDSLQKIQDTKGDVFCEDVTGRLLEPAAITFDPDLKVVVVGEGLEEVRKRPNPHLASVIIWEFKRAVPEMISMAKVWSWVGHQVQKAGQDLWLKIYEDDEDDIGTVYRVDVQRGIQLFKEKFPHINIFTLLDEPTEGSADLFLQLSCFGEIRFG